MHLVDFRPDRGRDIDVFGSQGTGWISGADNEPRPIGAGEAVFWEAGEEHEIWTDDGLTMIVIEAADAVQPYEPRSPS
jgi:hypothetical protein